MARWHLQVAVSLIALMGASSRAVAQTVPASPPVSAVDAGATPAAAPIDNTASADIVVTAQKRAQSVQQVPISVVAVSGAQLEKSGVQNVLDLTKIAPGFTTTRQSEVSSLRLNIRGVGGSTQTARAPAMASRSCR